MTTLPLTLVLLVPAPTGDAGGVRSFEGPQSAPTASDAAPVPIGGASEPTAEALREQQPAAQPDIKLVTAAEPKSKDRFDRRGLAMSISTGIASCTATLCADIPMAGIGRFEIGSRHGMVEFFGGVSFGGGRVDVEGVDGSLTFMDSGGGLRLLPIRTGRIDPWVGASIGYGRTAERIKTDAAESRVVYSRGVVRPGVGFAIAVTKHMYLGPRFDVGLGFAGEVCTEHDDTTDAEDAAERCDDISKILDTETKLDDRLLRRELPRPWAITIDFRTVF